MRPMIPNPQGVTVDFTKITVDEDWRDILPGRSFCQCTGCGDYFNSVTGFDKHFEKNEEGRIIGCKTPNEMVSLGMLRNMNQLWITEPLDYLYYHIQQAEEVEDENRPE